jgi:hypothetical protein
LKNILVTSLILAFSHDVNPACRHLASLLKYAPFPAKYANTLNVLSLVTIHELANTFGISGGCDLHGLLDIACVSSDNVSSQLAEPAAAAID